MLALSIWSSEGLCKKAWGLCCFRGLGGAAASFEIGLLGLALEVSFTCHPGIQEGVP